MCKKSRLVSLLLAMILSLAACGGNTSSDSTTPQDTSAVTTEPLKIDHLEEIPKVDFGGDKIRMVVQSQSDRPNIHTDEENGEVVNDAMIVRDRKVSEMFSCELEYTVYDNRGTLYSDLTTLISAGEDAYDIIITTMVDGFGNLAANQMLYDLNSLDALKLGSEWWCQSMNETMTFGDKIFATSGPMSLCYCYTPYTMFANLNMAEDYGVGDIYELVKSGKWTVDSMNSLMKDVYTDLNSNGTVDYDDRFPLTVTKESGIAFYIGCGMRLTEKTPTSAQLTLDSARSFDVLDKLNSIMKNDEVLCTDTIANIQNSSDPKTAFFINSQALFCAAPIQWGVLKFRDMKDDYAILPYPKFDEVQDEYYTHLTAYFPIGIGIPATCPRADKIASVMEALAYISNRDILPQINNTVLKAKIARDENSAEMLDLLYKNTIVDFDCVFNIARTANTLRDYAVGESEDFASSYASVKTQAETQINDLMTKLIGE